MENNRFHFPSDIQCCTKLTILHCRGPYYYLAGEGQLCYVNEVLQKDVIIVCNICLRRQSSKNEFSRLCTVFMTVKHLFFIESFSEVFLLKGFERNFHLLLDSSILIS